MACYQPIRAYQRHLGGEVQLLPARGPRGEPANLELPCGKCLGCQQARATQWAERCKHEARSYRHNSFLTLTYNDRFLPEDQNLQPRDLQLFLKRLRKRVHSILVRQETTQPQRDEHLRILSNPRKPLRYFACGEYGEQTGRPHYHLLLFNADFQGLRIGNAHGHELRINQHVAAAWTDPKTHQELGNHSIGTALPGAVAGYIAKYVLKSHRFNIHHNPICDRDGVFNPLWIRPPFARMSKGIGKAWFQEFHQDLQRGYLVSDGRKIPIPRYYKKQLEQAARAAISEHHTQEATLRTATNLERYQHEYAHINKGDKNDPDRRQAQQTIHEQRHNNNTRR